MTAVDRRPGQGGPAHGRVPAEPGPDDFRPPASTTPLDQWLSYCKAKEQHGRALETHVSNARVRKSAAGIQIAKADKDSPARIDLTVCSIMAHDRAPRARARGLRSASSDSSLRARHSAAAPRQGKPCALRPSPALPGGLGCRTTQCHRSASQSIAPITRDFPAVTASQRQHQLSALRGGRGRITAGRREAADRIPPTGRLTPVPPLTWAFAQAEGASEHTEDTRAAQARSTAARVRSSESGQRCA